MFTNKKILIFGALLFLLIDCALVTLKINKEHQKPKIVHKEKPNYKYSVFLTSDDGPLVGSKNLNQIVEDYEFPLSVFLVGKPLSIDKNLEPNFKAYKNNPYILIGNHTFTHANLHYKKFYQDPDGVVADFLKNEKFLGITSKVARFPGRNVWMLDGNTTQKGEPNALGAAQKLFTELKYRSFGWDYELRHKNGVITLSGQEHYKKIKQLLMEKKTYMKNEIVILMHDQMFTRKKSIKALEELVMLLHADDECKLKFINRYKVTK